MEDTFINSLIENNISIEKIDILKELYKYNNNLLHSINLDFVSSDYFTSLDFNMLKYITTIEETQKDLLKLDQKKKTIFLFLINKYSKLFYYPPYFQALLTNLCDSKYDLLINEINIYGLTEQECRRLSIILTSKKNNLNIESLEDFKNYDLTIENNLSNSFTNNNVEEYKNYILLQKASISLEEAKLLCQKYCYNLDNLKTNNLFINILKLIKEIVTEEDINIIRELTKDIKPIALEYPNYQTLSQNLYEEIYNNELFNPEHIEGEIIDGVKVVDAGVNFYMIARCDGAFSSTPNNSSNYYEKWNSNIRTTYSFSNSHISNSRLLMYSLQSRDNLLTYGFSKLPENSIVENALGDNATLYTRIKTLDPRSYRDNKKISPYTFDSCGQRFLSLKDTINHSSRDVHTEITLERFYYDINGDEHRINPSYIIYTKKDKNYKEDPLFKESLKACKDFNIPLVIIDFNKVLKNEQSKITTLMNEPINIETVKEIIQIYSNNAIKGLNKEYQDIVDYYFPTRNEDINFIEELIKNLINKAKSNNFPKEFYQELFDFLMKINIEKKIVSAPFLLKFKENFNLEEHIEEYYDYTYGITYLNYSDEEKSNCIYDYLSWKNIFDTCKKYNIEITEDMYDLNTYTIGKILEECLKRNITPQKDYLYFKSINELITNFNK